MTQEVEVTARPLAELEAIIERGLSTFVEVGQALLEIRDSRAYRVTHLTFQDYCRERWGMSRPRAYQLMQAAEVASSLSTNVDTPPLETEAQARELTRLPQPETVREVWAEVKEEKGERVTAADVRQAVDRRLGVERPPPEPTPDPEYGYAEPIADSQGVEHVSCSLTTAAPEQPATVEIPNTQTMRDAYLRADALKCNRFAAQMVAYAPDRVAAVLALDDAEAVERTLDRLADWRDQFKAARGRGLRVVGGEA